MLAIPLLCDVDRSLLNLLCTAELPMSSGTPRLTCGASLPMREEHKCFGDLGVDHWRMRRIIGGFLVEGQESYRMSIFQRLAQAFTDAPLIA